MITPDSLLEMKGYTLCVNGKQAVSYPVNLAEPISEHDARCRESVALGSCASAAGIYMHPLTGGWPLPVGYWQAKVQLRQGYIVFVGEMPACKARNIITLEILPIMAPKKFDRGVWHIQ